MELVVGVGEHVEDLHGLAARQSLTASWSTVSKTGSSSADGRPMISSTARAAACDCLGQVALELLDPGGLGHRGRA